MAHGELYPLVDPGARKAQIVARMQAQRELWELNRAVANGESAAGRFTHNPAVRLALQHPLAAAGIAGVLLMLGPRRLLRLSTWVLPLILRR